MSTEDPFGLNALDEATGELEEAITRNREPSRTVRVAIDGPEISFDGNDDLDCPYLGYTRVVPADGYIDVPNAFVTQLEGHR